MHRAAEKAFDSGAIIYDALFLALAKDAETAMITADNSLLKTLQGTDYATLARSLREIDSLLQ